MKFRIVAAIAIVLGFGLIGNEDYNEALLQQQDYCERVEIGVHTNYKEVDCNIHKVKP